MAVTLVEQVYNQLLKMITRRELEPGDRLSPEVVSCDQMGVSRNTLQAALNKLDALGFTVPRQDGGTYVKEVDNDVYLNFFVPALLTHDVNLLEVIQSRKGIEVEAVRPATTNVTDEDTAELSELLEHCKGGSDEMERFAQFNTDSYTAIAKASYNIMFKKTTEIIRMMTLTETQNSLVAQGEDVDSAFYHKMVLRCIIEGKPEEAVFSMECHLTLVTKRVKKYVERETEND